MKLFKDKAKSKMNIYFELSKLNILSLVLVATFLGYYLGSSGINSWEHLFFTLLGTTKTAQVLARLITTWSEKLKIYDQNKK
ncbi:MAG: hypothetical protein Ct9H90mP20_3620 [Candidatus Neomarinimicrobiota bacterium]|nr:MAG: hypothetical protein Ct9H90mP20_3620 [Candidatus Neomarinimicrobiota bacterium]